MVKTKFKKRFNLYLKNSIPLIAFYVVVLFLAFNNSGFKIELIFPLGIFIFLVALVSVLKTKKIISPFLVIPIATSFAKVIGNYITNYTTNITAIVILAVIGLASVLIVKFYESYFE